MSLSIKPWGWLFIAIICIVSLWMFFKREVAIPVKLHIVSTGVVKKTVANTRVGSVKACKRAYLAPGKGGEVIALNVKEGDQVTQGQILLEVWNLDIKAQLQQHRAEIASSRANANQACVTASGSKRVANRLLQLQKHNSIVSEETVDLAKTKAEAEQAACHAALKRIAVAQARFSSVETALQRSRLKAPFNGTVAEINAELGEYITPSPPGIPTLPAIDLIDDSCLYISAPIDEVDAPLIRTGMPACVSLDAFNDQRCSGKVVRIAPYVQEKEKQARTVTVEVKLSDPKELQDLLPGYSADIEVLIEQRRNTLRIPTAAIFEGNQILIRNADGVLQQRRIEIGLQNWNYTEVVSGLSSGDEIVLSIGSEGIKTGAVTQAQTDTPEDD